MIEKIVTDNNTICIKDIKHIIWDYNGTLLNDIDLCVDVINVVLDRRGLSKISKQHYKTVFDFPVRDYYEAIGFDFSKESFDIVGTEFIDRYNSEMHTAKLHQHAIEVLSLIDKLGIKQSILSARLQQSLDVELKTLGIEKFFSHISGLSNHYAHGKLENGIELIDKIALPPDEILVIGDTLHDLDVAREKGTKELLIADGHQTYERLLKGSSNVIHSLSEMLEMINNGGCLEFSID